MHLGMLQTGACVGMFDAEHLHHSLPRLRAVVFWKESPPLFPFRDPPHRRPEFSAEHQAMKCLSPVLRRFFLADGGEVLGTGPQCVLHEHRVMLRLPRIQALFYPSLYIPGCCDMAGPLERHCLKDNEMLRAPTPVKHPPQLPRQDVDIPPPYLPARRFVALLWHDREVTLPPLPRPVFCNPSVQICARVPVDPVSVDLPET